MKKRAGKASLAAPVSLVALAAMVAPASAAILPFSGTVIATAAPVPDPSCDPLPFRGIATGPAGSSNLGAFIYSHNVCTQGGPSGGTLTGTFVLDFGGSLLSGLLNGTTTPRAGTPGLQDQVFNFTIQSGTGFLSGATGSFTNTGTVDTRGGPPSRLTLNLEGAITTVDVPEPPAAAMLMLGIAIVAARKWMPKAGRADPA